MGAIVHNSLACRKNSWIHMLLWQLEKVKFVCSGGKSLFYFLESESRSVMSNSLQPLGL